MAKKHKTFSSAIGMCGEWNVWTACGLGEPPPPGPSGREGYEFEVAINDGEVSCKSCLRSMAKTK